jgi:hypothetical protein
MRRIAFIVRAVIVGALGVVRFIRDNVLVIVLVAVVLILGLGWLGRL